MTLRRHKTANFDYILYNFREIKMGISSES